MNTRKTDIIIEGCTWGILVSALTFLPAAQFITLAWHRIEDERHHYVGTNAEAYVVAGCFIVVGLACLAAITHSTISNLQDWREFEDALDNGGHWSEEDRRNECELNAHESQSTEC